MTHVVPIFRAEVGALTKVDGVTVHSRNIHVLYRGEELGHVRGVALWAKDGLLQGSLTTDPLSPSQAPSGGRLEVVVDLVRGVGELRRFVVPNVLWQPRRSHPEGFHQAFHSGITAAEWADAKVTAMALLAGLR